MFFQTADKNEDINFKLKHLTYYRDPIAVANIKAPDGSLTNPIATLIMMMLKSHEYLVATCVGQPVSTRLLKKVVRNSNGDSLRVTDCFDMHEWRPGTLKLKVNPLEKVSISVKALQDIPRAYFGRDSGATIHSMRARAVSVQQGQQVNQAVIKGLQGRRGDIPATYTNVEHSMLQNAGNMVAPPVESLWAVTPTFGNQGGRPSSSAIRQGPPRAPPVGGGKTPRPPQPFPEDYAWNPQFTAGDFELASARIGEQPRRRTAADFAKMEPELRANQGRQATVGNEGDKPSPPVGQRRRRGRRGLEALDRDFGAVCPFPSPGSFPGRARIRACPGP